MSKEQLASFIEAAKADAGLQKKLDDASDLDAVLAIVKQAGFDVIKADFLKANAIQILEMSDEELESAVGGAQGGFMSMNWWVVGKERAATWDPRGEFAS